jgi:hypothetical protein
MFAQTTMDRASKSHHQFLGCWTNISQSFLGKLRATQAMIDASTNHLIALTMTRGEIQVRWFMSMKKPRQLKWLPRFVFGLMSGA